MDLIRIYKVLSNPIRAQIVEWLKNPSAHFQEVYEEGVCVSDIQKKAQLSQSTISQYLALLQDTGLIQATRKGQWTFYKRNEANIEKVKQKIMNQL